MVVMRELRAAGFEIPRDMSILGFDGLALGELLSPPLASVCAPNRDLGRHAWGRLAARIAGTHAGDDSQALALTLPHSVRDGGTIAVPRSGDKDRGRPSMPSMPSNPKMLPSS